jgi:hypothetical protein
MVGTLQSVATRVARRQKFVLLDLRNSPLTIYGRLCLEEYLLRHDPFRGDGKGRNWTIIGNSGVGTGWRDDVGCDNGGAGCVVLGLGGKIPLLVKPTCPLPLLRRFSGGGTVVVDPSNTLYASFIGRPGLVREEGPRGVMNWSGECLEMALLLLLPSSLSSLLPPHLQNLPNRSTKSV